MEKRLREREETGDERQTDRGRKRESEAVFHYFSEPPAMLTQLE